MPFWLSAIVSLILKFALPILVNDGLPALLAWLKQKFPWLPADEIAKIIQKLVGQTQMASVQHGEGTAAYHAAVKGHLAQAASDLNAVCSGVACPPHTVAP